MVAAAVTVASFLGPATCLEVETIGVGADRPAVLANVWSNAELSGEKGTKKEEELEGDDKKERLEDMYADANGSGGGPTPGVTISGDDCNACADDR